MIVVDPRTRTTPGAIRRALESQGSIRAAARSLGMSSETLRYLCAEWGIPTPRGKYAKTKTATFEQLARAITEYGSIRAASKALGVSRHVFVHWCEQGGVRLPRGKVGKPLPITDAQLAAAVAEHRTATAVAQAYGVSRSTVSDRCIAAGIRLQRKVSR